MADARRRRRPPKQVFQTRTAVEEQIETPVVEETPRGLDPLMLSMGLEDAEFQDADALPISIKDKPAPKQIDPRLLDDQFDEEEFVAKKTIKPTPRKELVKEPQATTSEDGELGFDDLLDQITNSEDEELEEFFATSEPLQIEEPEYVESDEEAEDEESYDQEQIEEIVATTTVPYEFEAETPNPLIAALEEEEDEDEEIAEPDASALFARNKDAQEGELFENSDFWDTVQNTDDEDEDAPPTFKLVEEVESEGFEPVLTPQTGTPSLFRRNTPDTQTELERLESLEPISKAPTEPTEEEVANTQIPLAVDEEQAPAGKEWKPPVHVAARQGMFGGPSALSLISPTIMKDDVDELNHAIGAFADLEKGQKGFIRLSIRTYPEFRSESAAWVAAKKSGIDPDAGKGSLAKRVSQFTGYLFKYVWFMANQSSRHLGGSVPPLRPGAMGGVTQLKGGPPATDDEKQTYKDAETKARDTAHFEVDLRVGVVGKNEDAEEIERIADESAAGFDAFITTHQKLVWQPVDPYDTCIGFMGATLDSTPSLNLSAAELGELARIPDGVSKPQGVKVQFSRFKEMPIGNALLIDDPYNPPPGFIPLGRMNANSDDEKCFGMRNDELDQHMFYSGRTGTGKSELMKWLIFGVAKDRSKGFGFPIVIVDPHGALSEEILNMLVVNCPERIQDIVFCDLSDEEFPVALNPLDIHHKDQVGPTVSSIMEMLDKQLNLGQSAPRAQALARNALTALCWANINLEDPDTKCTLLHIVAFFTDPEFRRLVVEFCENVSVRETFDAENGPFESLSEKQKTEYTMPIIRAFSMLGSVDSFEAVFSSGENRLNFGDLILQKKIVIVKLSRYSHQAAIGEFIGSLILPWLLSSMDDWGRKKDPDTGVVSGTGCRVFVDEAPTMFGARSSVPQVLAEARKWNFGLISASQFLNQFDKGIMESLLANTASKIALGLEISSAKSIAGAIAGTTNVVSANDIAELPNYHYYGNILLPGDDGARAPSGPFSAACLPVINSTLTDEHKVLRQQVRDRSRALVANPADDVFQRRLHAKDNIKSALGELLRDRVDLGGTGSTDTSGTDLGFDGGAISDDWDIWSEE